MNNCITRAALLTNAGSGSMRVSGCTALKRMMELRLCRVLRTRCGVARSRPACIKGGRVSVQTGRMGTTEGQEGRLAVGESL